MEDLSEEVLSNQMILHPVRCYTCGKVLARGDMIKQYEKIVKETGDIGLALDTIGVTRVCCRTNVICPSIVPFGRPSDMSEIQNLEERLNRLHVQPQNAAYLSAPLNTMNSKIPPINPNFMAGSSKLIRQAPNTNSAPQISLPTIQKSTTPLPMLTPSNIASQIRKPAFTVPSSTIQQPILVPTQLPPVTSSTVQLQPISRVAIVPPSFNQSNIPVPTQISAPGISPQRRVSPSQFSTPNTQIATPGRVLPSLQPLSVSRVSPTQIVTPGRVLPSLHPLSVPRVSPTQISTPSTSPQIVTPGRVLPSLQPLSVSRVSPTQISTPSTSPQIVTPGRVLPSLQPLSVSRVLPSQISTPGTISSPGEVPTTNIAVPGRILPNLSPIRLPQTASPGRVLSTISITPPTIPNQVAISQETPNIPFTSPST